MTISTSHKTVSADDLTIDTRVQRIEGINQQRINRMAEKFDPLALGTITLSQRQDGRLVVLDGMHRGILAKQVGYTGFLNAEVITGLTLQHEAALFVLLNAAEKPSAVSIFLAGVVMQDTDHVTMNDTIESHGWRVQNGTKDGYLTAVAAVIRIHKSSISAGHPETLDRVLEIVTAAWDHDYRGVNAHMLEAVAQLINRFGASIDTKKLVTEMSDTRPNILIGHAKVLRDAQGGVIPAALAKILAGMHNKKRRNNLLPEWVWIR